MRSLSGCRWGSEWSRLPHVDPVPLLQPWVLGNKLSEKDNAGSGVQFITPAGPRQSLLLAKDPGQLL